MKIKIFTLFIIFSFLLQIPIFLFAIGPRAMGMAGAFTGIADDASDFFWNPAGLAFQERTGIATAYNLVDKKYWTAHSTYYFPCSSITAMRSDASGKLLWDGNNGTSILDTLIFSHAIPIGDAFAVGFNLKGLSLNAASNMGFGTDIGILLKTPIFKFGLNVQDIMSQIAAVKLNRTYHVGFGFGPFATAMIGAQMDVTDLGTTNINGLYFVPQIRTGAEGWLFKGLVGIRGGYYIVPCSLFNGLSADLDEQAITLGASLKLKYFSIDYSFANIFAPIATAQQNHYIGMGFMWGKTKQDVAIEAKTKAEAAERERKTRELLLINAYSDTISKKNVEIIGLKNKIEDMKSEAAGTLRAQIEKLKADSQALSIQLISAQDQLKKLGVENVLAQEDALALKQRLEKIRAIAVVDPLLKEAVSKNITTSNELSVAEIAEGLRIRINRDYFFNKTSLGSNAYKPLDVIIRALKDFPGHAVLINGYSDSLGTKKANIRISTGCAKTVSDYMTAKGIDEKQLFVNGYGIAKPIAPNNTKAGRKQNRRVEIIIYKQ